jgi:hypothetical protein
MTRRSDLPSKIRLATRSRITGPDVHKRIDRRRCRRRPTAPDERGDVDAGGVRRTGRWSRLSRLRGALGRKWASCPTHEQAACPAWSPWRSQAREHEWRESWHGTCSCRGRPGEAERSWLLRPRHPHPAVQTRARGSHGRRPSLRDDDRRARRRGGKTRRAGGRSPALLSIHAPATAPGRAKRWSCARASRSACSRGWRPSARMGP